MKTPIFATFLVLMAIGGHWDTCWWSSISDGSVRKLLHFMFDAGSVVFN